MFRVRVCKHSAMNIRHGVWVRGGGKLLMLPKQDFWFVDSRCAAYHIPCDLLSVSRWLRSKRKAEAQVVHVSTIQR